MKEIIKEGSRFEINKKKLITVISMITLFVVLLVTCSFIGNDDFSVVAMIDGEPVTVREYHQALLKVRADTYAYFKGKYGVDDNPGFWTDNYGGEVPLQKIKQDALDDLKAIKVQQILAKENGMIQDITYESFLKDFNRENANREKALKNNQVIFGPQQYNEQNYFDNRFTNMVSDLKKKLMNEIPVDANEIERYYKENIHKFQEGDTISIEKIAIRYPDDEMKMKAVAFLCDMKGKMDSGASFEEAKNDCMKDFLVLDHDEYIFEPQNARADAMLYENLYYTASELTVGQTSDNIIENGTIYFIRCIERTEGKTVPFEDVKDLIKRELVEKEYENMVNMRIEATEIVIDEKTYQEIDEKYVH